MSIVWASDLPKSSKMVLLAYSDFADDDGGSVFPSRGRIAWKTGYSRRQVVRITKTLVELGYMTEVDSTKWGTVVYRINLGALPDLPPYTGGDKMSQADAEGVTLTTADVTKTTNGVTSTTKGVTLATDQGASMSPDPSLDPLKIHQESPTEIKDAIQAIIKPIYLPEELDKLEEVAGSFVDSGISSEQIEGFKEWWIAAGYYSGPSHMEMPSLKIFVRDFLKYLDEADVYA